MPNSRIKHITVPGMRLHLRRGDPNMLWVNGQNLVLVNRTAADFIEAFIEVMSGYRDSLDSGLFKDGIVAAMQKRALEPKRLRLVHPYADRPASLALVEAVKGGRTGVEVLAPLIVHDRGGGYSKEMQEIYGLGLVTTGI